MNKHNSGFSLIELIIAIVLLSMIGSVTALIYTTTLGKAHLPRKMMQAEFLSLERIEQAWANTYSDSLGYASIIDDNEGALTTIGYADFSRNMSVLTIAAGVTPCPTFANECKQLSVVVTDSNTSDSLAQSTALIIQ
ncbi:MAG: prepilin-type N-terminal cleavage/methylation domain-containing protein [Gammaproteobacteria bacterium]|nr:prepilin-type N-terminal cleavage/methylation domain-containing protein [Gammaproteobacteria bacterium]